MLTLPIIQQTTSPVKELATDNRWRQGPAFLWQPQDHWPIIPDQGIIDSCELRKSICCNHVAVAENHSFPNPNWYNSFKDLIEAAVLLRHEAAGKQGNATADKYKLAETDLLRKSQQDRFLEDFDCLAMGRPVPTSSRLITLTPEYDPVFQLIRVGGRLRRSDQLDPDTIHPVVLDPAHKVTQLLIQDMDHQSCHTQSSPHGAARSIAPQTVYHESELLSPRGSVLETIHQVLPS